MQMQLCTASSTANKTKECRWWYSPGASKCTLWVREYMLATTAISKVDAWYAALQNAVALLGVFNSLHSK